MPSGRYDSEDTFPTIFFCAIINDVVDHCLLRFQHHKIQLLQAAHHVALPFLWYVFTFGYPCED